MFPALRGEGLLALRGEEGELRAVFAGAEDAADAGDGNAGD